MDVGRRTVGKLMASADLRLGDASCLANLLKSGKPPHRARANGLIYLSGIAIEIMLKVRLMRIHPSLAYRSKRDLVDPLLHDLCWKSHDLAGVWGKVFPYDSPLSLRLKPSLGAVASQWSIDLRYDPVQRAPDAAIGVYDHALLLFKALDPR